MSPNQYGTAVSRNNESKKEDNYDICTPRIMEANTAVVLRRRMR